MDGGIGALGDIDGGWERKAGHAESAEAGLEEGGPDDGVEGVAGVVSDGNEDFNIGLGVSHFQRNLPAGHRPCCACGGRGVEAAAGELVEGVFVEVASFGEFQGEMGRGERGNCQEGSYCVLHVEGEGEGCIMWDWGLVYMRALELEDWRIGAIGIVFVCLFAGGNDRMVWMD